MNGNTISEKWNVIDEIEITKINANQKEINKNLESLTNKTNNLLSLINNMLEDIQSIKNDICDIRDKKDKVPYIPIWYTALYPNLITQYKSDK